MPEASIPAVLRDQLRDPAIRQAGDQRYAAVGGDAGVFSSIFELIGSDVIATGNNGAGNGGDGHFAGSLIDLNIAIYAPINIAVAGPNSTADAHQTNNVLFDQRFHLGQRVGGLGQLGVSDPRRGLACGLHLQHPAAEAGEALPMLEKGRHIARFRTRYTRK